MVDKRSGNIYLTPIDEKNLKKNNVSVFLRELDFVDNEF